MDSPRERWTRVLITVGLFLLAASLYVAWALQQEGRAFTLLDLFRDAPPPEPAPLESITTSSSPAVDLADVALLSRLNEEYARLIQAVLPSVVKIELKQSVNLPLRSYNPLGKPETSIKEFLAPTGSGSGVIVSREGHILTNYHVVEGNDEIFVTLHDGGRYKARVIGSDRRADIAVLKIAGGVSKSFASLALANSDEVRVGEMVFALGSPFGFSESVTKGIISAKERRISDADTSFFQTDAGINPGSSGGPLINLRGEVIGLNVFLYGRDDGPTPWNGVGLAIPSNDVRAAFAAILTEGGPRQGYLGISVEDIYPDTAIQLGLNSSSGAVIMEVVHDSPAQLAGLQADDVVLTFNGESVTNTTGLIARVHRESVGAKVVLGLLRDRLPASVEVTIGERSTAVPLAAQRTRPGVLIGSLSDFLGIEVETLDASARLNLGLRPEAPAVIITAVRPGTLAAASLRAGDLVHVLNRQPIYSREEFIRGINSIPVNRTSALLITRNGKRAYFILETHSEGNGG